VTVGLDLGDRFSQFVVLDADGEILEEGRVATQETALRQRFSGCQRLRIAIETGTHSPWVARVLSDCGHEVLVANSRRLRLIYENRRKSDKVDAGYLARLARVDPKLLAPVAQRGEAAQTDLALIRSRFALVNARTQLVNHARGIVKSSGQRLPRCSTPGFHKKVVTEIPQPLRESLLPIVETVGFLTEQIKGLYRRLESVANEKYPQTKLLRQVTGVGSITSLVFVLTIEDPSRFRKSRMVGAFLGLVPRQEKSGDSDPQLRITKQGDRTLRRLLVQAAHYILGAFGPDSDLRRFGLAISSRGGKNAPRRGRPSPSRASSRPSFTTSGSPVRSTSRFTKKPTR
jgi:transposase